MTVTIKDIAQKLNISYSSVSRALNNKPGVSEKTREKIVAEAEAMGYQPNDLARGLVKKYSNTIGVMIPDMLNPFFGEIAKGIIETARVHGYNVFLCITNWDAELEKEYLQTLQEKRVDGIVLKSTKDYKKAVYKDIKVPFILLESWPNKANYSFVEVDNEKGGYLATKHLLDCGYKRIAFIGGKKDSYSNIQRMKGYKRALYESKIAYDSDLIMYGEFNAKSGYDICKKLLSKNGEIDAIFAGNDVMALGVLRCAEKMGLRVPEDIGVVGFDNISYAELPQIKLTTVHQPKYALGKIIFETLLDEIKNADEKVARRVTLEPELIVRKTTRCK